MKFLQNFPGKCPRRGIMPAGRYSIRFFSEPFDASDGGDLWDVGMFEEGEFDPGGIVLFVGDVMGHGYLAMELRKKMAPIKLFRACLSKAAINFNPVKLFDAMDRELKDLNLPEDTSVQVALAYFTGAGTGTCTFAPESALVAQDMRPEVDRTLSMTASLLGHRFFEIPLWWASTKAVTQDFPRYAELVLGTDGLYDQVTPEKNLLKADLIRDLPAFRPDLPLVGQVCRRWCSAVEASEQDDDMLTTSVRHMHDDERMVFEAMQGNAIAADALYERYKRLVAKVVRSIVEPEANGAGRGDASISSGISRDDIAQDVWLHLIGNLSKWSGGIIYSWVRRTAFNYVISWLRKQQTTSRRKEQALGAMEITDTSDVGGTDELQLRELVERAYAYLEQLPAPHLKLLKLRQEGHSEAEICELLEISRRTYFNWMKRIRDNFPK